MNVLSSGDNKNLSFVLQHYLPLPENLQQCPHRQMLLASTDTVHSIKSEHYSHTACGSYAEWLALPYKIYQETAILVQPAIITSPDLDIVKINKQILVTSKSLENSDIPNKEQYLAIFQMVQLSSTHAGYVILELVFRQPQPRGPCQFCGHEECDKMSTFLPLVLPGKTEIQCLRSCVREHENRQGVENGPAFTTSTCTFGGQYDTDNVDAIACPEWPPMATHWQSRDRPGNWPSPALMDKILKSGCLVVPVSHSKSLHPDYEWRLSFSQAEVSLARSLSDVQRKCYLIVKTFFKTSLCEPAVLSSYHLKTLMFWQCEQIPENTWHKSNMADCVIGLIDSLLKSLSVKKISHYFIPEHNLIDHIDPNDIETIKVKVEDLRANLCQHLLQGFIALMPCCVQGKTVICVKEIFAEVFRHCRTGNILSSTDRMCFLQNLAEYYFILGRYDIFTDLCQEYVNNQSSQSQGMSRLEDSHAKKQSGKTEQLHLDFLLNLALRITPDPRTAYNWMANPNFTQHCINEADLMKRRNQMVRLHYALLPRHIPDEQVLKVLRNNFKTKMITLMAQNEGNPKSAAISAYITWQLGDVERALEEVQKGLAILSELKFHSGERFVESKSESISLISQSNNPSLEGDRGQEKKDQPLAKRKEYFGLTNSMYATQVHFQDMSYSQKSSFSPNTVLFYDVHINSLDKTLQEAIQRQADRNPVSMPTELLMLYTKYKCLQDIAGTEMVDLTRREMLETMERKYPYLNINDVNMIKSICSLDNK